MRRRVAAMPSPACIKDETYHFIAANQAFADIFGLEAAAFSGCTWGDVVDPERVSEWSEMERRCLVSGQCEPVVLKDALHRLSYVAMMERFEGIEGEFYICCVMAQTRDETGAEADLTRATTAPVSSMQTIPVADSNGQAELQAITESLHRRFGDVSGETIHEGDFQDCLSDHEIGIMVYDRNDILRFANSAFFEMYEPYWGAVVAGMHITDVLGVFYDTIIASDRQKTIAGYEANRDVWIARRMEVYARPMSDIEIRMPDGRWVRAYNRRFEDGTSIGLRMDITASKINAMQDDVIAVPDRSHPATRIMEDVLDAMPVGVLVLSRDLVIEYVNVDFYRQMESRLGRTRKLIGMPLREFIKGNMEAGLFPLGTASSLMTLEEHLAFVQEATGEAREFGLADGLALSFRSHKLKDGQFLVTCCDLSDLRRQDAEVVKAHQRLTDTDRLRTQIASVMDQGLLVIEEDRVIFSNNAVYRLLGLPQGFLNNQTTLEDGFELCSRRGDFASNEKAANQTFGEIRGAIASGETLSRSLYMESLQRWVTIDLLPLEEQRVAAVLTDITQQKLREKELEELIERAETADRTKSLLLSSIGHEIRTPMNGVVGMTELLKKSNLDSRQKTFVDIIANSGQSLMTILNDILDASKIGAGDLTLNNSVFSPADAIADVATHMSEKASEKAIDLVVHCDPALPAGIVGDVVRFRQILTRLVGNAVKFTEVGHVLISATAENDGENGKRLVVKVKDTGLGIPPNHLADFNAIFEEVSPSHVHVHNNTDLGLSIAGGLANIMGGTLRAESVLGQGATLTMNLPYETRDETPFITLDPVVFADTRMIVVDPVVISREILLDHLQAQGVDAIGVDDGETAIEVMRHAKESGVSVDVLIASGKGTQAEMDACMTKIHGSGVFKDVPIVVLMSLDIISGGSMKQSMPFDAYVMKPVRMNLLQKALIDIIAIRKRNTTSPDMWNALQVPPQMQSPARIAQAEVGGWADKSIDVLLVEDNYVNQFLISQVLEDLGCQFHFVSDARDAVLAFQSMRPRLILMDVTLPIVCGYEACRQIRQIEAGAEDSVRIVGLVPNATYIETGDWAAAGMDHCLAKPLNPLNLEEAIAEWLGLEDKRQVA